MPVARAKKNVSGKKKPAGKKPAKQRPAVRKKPVPRRGAERPAPAGRAVPLFAEMRLEVTYKGRVQGVGFRFNAEQAALLCGVTGWVRNEHNGDVHLVAEGPESKLLRLLDEIRKCPVGRHIVRERVSWAASRSEFNDFRIEYHC